MLNELLMIERGMRRADINMPKQHQDIKDAGRKPTLIVQLNKKGRVASVRPLPSGATPWTLRDGQHNSFPFVQIDDPFWELDGGNNWREKFSKKRQDARRRELLDLASKVQYQIDEWPSKRLLRRLRERGKQLVGLKKTDAALIRTTIGRFLSACRPTRNGMLLKDVIYALMENLKKSAQEEWITIAVALLVGKKNKSKWLCSGALLFEAEGYALSIADPKLKDYINIALKNHTGDNAKNLRKGICGLTGRHGQLLAGKFHQPILQHLGQSFLFSKNSEIPANDRYGRFADEAMPVIQETAECLDAAIRAITSGDRKNKTWRAVPGEAPKQNDLLIAFVEGAIDAPVVESLAEEDFSSERSKKESDTVDSIAAFEKRTERTIDLVKAKVGNDVTKTPVQLTIIRKLDLANRKVVYAGAFTVADLYRAAIDWTKGERNVPAWLKLPVLLKGESKPRSISPPHVSPLGLIEFSKQIFLRSGEHPKGKKKEQSGLAASDALRFFVDNTKGNYTAQLRVERVLRLLLVRRAALLYNVAHVQHSPECWNRRLKEMKKLDHYEALRTITLLGILLHKLYREEAYMDETAFKLGQLLAGADIIHAGYCADVRGGAIPPSLLGNQIFNMAQAAPIKALAVLCLRWKPYGGWAKRAARETERIEKLVSSQNKTDQKRGWDIREALSYARRIRPLADDLAPALADCRTDDTFRAELLLGYIAGLPRVHKEEVDVQDQNKKKED